ncbi:sulfite exporter TauE/SafE family protein [Methylovorus mays]|uniref:sulfite exporter TauE/SafE family protein n=1 Tax=Methylovorus mays TaxID=184077 RepID=UPI001E388D97|nr:sulfite exporter TauE/SafE family protein [Methylovorus mays]MCB5208045.1 sulfite exporter TauE/SafE family protein [Methylovorus mays]
MLEFTLFGVFMVGLLGGGHCAGMCGGIVGAVSMSLPGARPRLPFLLAYNGGRILSYTLAGVLAGALGASSFFLGHILPIQKILYGLSSLMLVLLGLYLAGVWHGVTYVERLGSVLWRQLQPLSRRLLPVQSPWQAILLGAVWGWLPCGLVYSVLVAALAAGDAVQGGLLMLAFGLGTLPTLLAMGMAAVKLKKVLQQGWLRKLSGLAVILFGLFGLYRVLL